MRACRRRVSMNRSGFLQAQGMRYAEQGRGGVPALREMLFIACADHPSVRVVPTIASYFSFWSSITCRRRPRTRRSGVEVFLSHWGPPTWGYG